MKSTDPSTPPIVSSWMGLSSPHGSAPTWGARRLCTQRCRRRRAQRRTRWTRMRLPEVEACRPSGLIGLERRDEAHESARSNHTAHRPAFICLCQPTEFLETTHTQTPQSCCVKVESVRATSASAPRGPRKSSCACGLLRLLGRVACSTLYTYTQDTARARARAWRRLCNLSDSRVLGDALGAKGSGMSTRPTRHARLARRDGGAPSAYDTRGQLTSHRNGQ
jgi:hypothetical protein